MRRYTEPSNEEGFLRQVEMSAYTEERVFFGRGWGKLVKMRDYSCKNLFFCFLHETSIDV